MLKENKEVVVCPLCDSDMEYKTKNDTHIWACKECPAILFEFYNSQDIMEVRQCIEKI